jgi:hypothetical protein
LPRVRCTSAQTTKKNYINITFSKNNMVTKSMTLCETSKANSLWSSRNYNFLLKLRSLYEGIIMNIIYVSHCFVNLLMVSSDAAMKQAVSCDNAFDLYCHLICV